MDLRSEVILRQINYFKGNVLLAGAPADTLLEQLKHQLTQFTLWSWQFDHHHTLQLSYADHCYFSAEPPTQQFEQAIVFLPKSKELTEYLLRRIASHLPVHGQLFLVGEKKAGIERAAKQLQALGKTIKLDSARHCQLWQCRLSQPVMDKPLEQWVKTFTLDQAITTLPEPLTVISLPGVFSHGHLDQGTALLLRHLEQLPSGDLLDFGCGAGIIGTILQKKYPDQHIHFLDVDAFALAATHMTLAANNVDPVQTSLIAGRGIQDAPANLAAIISNPPFHQGIHTSYQASEALLRQATEHLSAQGELRIVANSFLRYAPIIEQHFKSCQVVAKQHGFHIYQAVKK